MQSVSLLYIILQRTRFISTFKSILLTIQAWLSRSRAHPNAQDISTQKYRIPNCNQLLLTAVWLTLLIIGRSPT